MQNNDFNKIIITGYANSEPVLNNTTGGTPVLNFELRTFMKRRSDIFCVTVWGDLAKLGSVMILPNEKLLIEGHIQHKRNKDLVLTDIVEVVAKRIYSLGTCDKPNDYASLLEI